jgi:hypothetical protein
MADKLRNQTWHQLPRSSRLANLMYPGLADEQTKRNMLDVAQQEGKREGLERRMKADVGSQMRRANWLQAQPEPKAVVPDYSRVPGLRRK